MKNFSDILLNNKIDSELKLIIKKVSNKERINSKEGERLFDLDVSILGYIANKIRENIHGDITYFNRNIHIEPTNICVFDCKFCSYSRLLKHKNEGWESTEEDILKKVESYKDEPITEIHIVGGVHPKMGLHYFANLIKKIKNIIPDIHIKAFTAVELEYMCRKSKVSFKEGLKILKDHGQDSLPGGGAEIFDENIRNKICKDKCSSDQWLEIHETAHKLGMPSNATMLYGHIEDKKHLIDHMNRLRKLQDKTGGFNTFIPLKFRNKNNQMSEISESSIVNDLKVYAISRIYMDNFKHLKAYWPMIGRNTAQLSLSFGVNDIDGTIDDTTKIYSMAGSEEKNPTLTTKELVELIKCGGRKPIERDTLYNIIKDYSNEDFKTKSNNYN